MKTHVSQIFRFYGRVLKESVSKFFREDVLTQSAAVAFYMIFSLPSILLIILWTAARVYREVAVREAIFAEFGDLVGKDGPISCLALSNGFRSRNPPGGPLPWESECSCSLPPPFW